MLAFPFVALAARRDCGAGAGAGASVSHGGQVLGGLRALGPALLLVVLWRVVWPAVLDGGRALRAHHRWAATEAAFRRGSETGRGSCSGGRRRRFRGPSPIEGAPNGVHLRIGADGDAHVHVRLGGGAVSAGSYALDLKVVDEAPERARLSIADRVFDLPTGSPAEVEVRLTHEGGPLEMDVGWPAPPGGSIWLTDGRIAASDVLMP